MLDILTRGFTIIFASLALALSLYYRLKVAPHLAPDMVERLPSYMRLGAGGSRVTGALLAILIILLVGAQLFLLVVREPITAFDILAPIAFALFDLALIVAMVRLLRHLTRGV